MDLLNFESRIDDKKEGFCKNLYETCVIDMSKMIAMGAVVVDIPKALSNDLKCKIAKELELSVSNTTKTIVKDAANTPLLAYDTMKTIDPNNFTHIVCKTAIDHASEEFESRKKTLISRYNKHMMPNNYDSIECYKEIVNYLEKPGFLNKTIGDNYKMMLNHLLTTEGVEIIEEIKDEILEEIEKTDVKNEVIIEAISAINDKKLDIETEINGGADNSENDPVDPNTTSNSNGTESLRMSSFIRVKNINSSIAPTIGDMSGVELSQEDLHAIRTDFSKFDPDMDLDDNVNDTDVNALSTADIEEDSAVADSNDGGDDTVNDSASTEDDIDVDFDKFDYNEEDEITPETLSEEAIAKYLVPLSVTKFANRNIQIDPAKTAAILCMSKDRGKMFFTSIKSRLQSIENSVAVAKLSEDLDGGKELKTKIDATAAGIKDIEEKADKLMYNLGIVGLLNGSYQLDRDIINNSVKKAVNPTAHANIRTESSESLSGDIMVARKDVVEIIEMALKINTIQHDLAKDINVSGNINKLGDLEELINEKILLLPVNLQYDVNAKVESLYALESIIRMETLLDIQNRVCVKPAKKEWQSIENFTEISAYGVSYMDIVSDIKKTVNEKFKDNGNIEKYGIDIDKVVISLCDTFKTDSKDMTTYEKILLKISEENKGIKTTGIDGILMRNKGKGIYASLIATDKLGLLTTESKVRILYHYLNK